MCAQPSALSQAARPRWRALLKQFARRLLRRPQPPVIISQHPFDLKHGVDTSGLLEPAQLHTGQSSDAEVTAYFGVPPSRLLNALERWRMTDGTGDLQRWRFIDVGSGKGRAILLASRLSFREVLGIELHPGLADIAKANLQHWRERESVVAPTSILRADAPSAIASHLDGAELLYLYNPFKPPILRKLLNVIISRQDALTGPVDILYLYPEYEDVFREFPQVQRLWQEQISISPEDEGDGLSAPTDPCNLYRLTPKQA